MAISITALDIKLLFRLLESNKETVIMYGPEDKKDALDDRATLTISGPKRLVEPVYRMLENPNIMNLKSD